MAAQGDFLLPTIYSLLTTKVVLLTSYWWDALNGDSGRLQNGYCGGRHTAGNWQQAALAQQATHSRQQATLAQQGAGRQAGRQDAARQSGSRRHAAGATQEQVPRNRQHWLCPLFGESPLWGPAVV